MVDLRPLDGPLDEGQTPLVPDEARGPKLACVATRGDINDAEGANIVEGMRRTHRQVKRKSVLVASEDFLRSLHQHMFGEVWDWAGRFRATERSFGVAPHQIAMELRQLFDNM